MRYLRETFISRKARRERKEKLFYKNLFAPGLKSYQFAIKNRVFRVCFQPRRFSSARLKTDSDLNLF
ncbi:MAG: hypothetical protein BWK80_46530 [Desulfobacteraceae bacterium IS3]|nr:MAG: hypothetical protein BWK80_46530 [Desulfobacteraceae bacterium IS3]